MYYPMAQMTRRNNPGSESTRRSPRPAASLNFDVHELDRPIRKIRRGETADTLRQPGKAVAEHQLQPLVLSI